MNSLCFELREMKIRMFDNLTNRYKKPKKKIKGGGGSLVLQPHHIQRNELEVPVNSSEFLNLPESEVPEQEVQSLRCLSNHKNVCSHSFVFGSIQMFFYKYFKQRNALRPELKKKNRKVQKDQEDIDFGSDEKIEDIEENVKQKSIKDKEINDEEVEKILREEALNEMKKHQKNKIENEKKQQKENIHVNNDESQSESVCPFSLFVRFV